MEADGTSLLKSAIEPPVTWAEARAELALLLSDPQFHCTERNRRFLKFVSEELFEGRQATIKAYTIAVDVFGRPQSFDPAIDPIVRIEATRLRASLSRYYELHGSLHDIHIDLPKGRYIPDFVRGHMSTATEASPAQGSRTLGVTPTKANSDFRWLHPTNAIKWLSIAVGTLGGFALGATLVAASFFIGR